MVGMGAMSLRHSMGTGGGAGDGGNGFLRHGARPAGVAGLETVGAGTVSLGDSTRPAGVGAQDGGGGVLEAWHEAVGACKG